MVVGRTSLLHVLFHCIHYSSLSSFPFPPAWQLHLQHPLSSISTIVSTAQPERSLWRILIPSIPFTPNEISFFMIHMFDLANIICRMPFLMQPSHFFPGLELAPQLPRRKPPHSHQSQKTTSFLEMPWKLQKVTEIIKKIWKHITTCKNTTCWFYWVFLCVDWWSLESSPVTFEKYSASPFPAFISNLLGCWCHIYKRGVMSVYSSNLQLLIRSL